jgi:alpha-tubulin suppressor-like RCC1 family protein
MGENDTGQLGNGTTTSHDAPVRIQSTGVSADEVIALACGDVHSLYIRGDGSLWAAGGNFHGQLGDGTTVNRLSFEEVVSGSVVAVAAGFDHSLFIKSGGGLWAMGDNSFGQFGDGSTSGSSIPVQVGVNVAAVAVGGYSSYFIKSDSSLWAMGYNIYGQLGDGTTGNRYLPVLIVSSNVVSVAAGADQACFIKSDGSLWAMGQNNYGQLGDGTFADRHSPVQVVPLVIPQPAITRISLAGTNLVLSGTNGESGRTCYTLMSPNLKLPLNQWQPVATNYLSTDGAFTVIATNAVAAKAAQEFFVLQTR